jgi:hypothetical protein
MHVDTYMHVDIHTYAFDFMHITLDNAFDRLKLEDGWPFHPRKGFEHTRGSETWDFYVVMRGRVPGIYRHWRVLHLFNSFT